MTTMQKQSSAALQSTVWVVTPTSTSADAANWQGALTAMAGIGRVIEKAGSATVTTALTFPEQTRLELSPDTVVTGTVPLSGGIQAPFFANLTLGSATTLAAQGNPGDITITVASGTGFVAGGYLYLYPVDGSSLTHDVACYRIKTVVGTTITLTRPLVRTWLIGGSGIHVYPVTAAAHDLQIEGNGATIAGTSDRAVEVVGAENPRITGLRVSGGGYSDVVIGLDLACVRGYLADHCVDGGSAAASCYSIESHEDGVIERVVGYGAASGCVIPASDHATVQHSGFWKNTTAGVYISTNTASATQGSDLTCVFNVWARSNPSGVSVLDRARDTLVLGGAGDLGTYGARADASGVTSATSHYTKWIGWRARANSSFGLAIGGGSLGNVSVGTHLAANAGGAVSVSAASTLTEVADQIEDAGEAGANPLIYVTGASSEYRAIGKRLVAAGGLGGAGIEVLSSGVALISDCTFSGVAGNGPMLKNSGGTLKVSRLRGIGAWPCAVYTSPGQTTELGEDCDFSTCTFGHAAAITSSSGASVATGGGSAIAARGTDEFTIEMVVKVPAAGASLALGGLHDGNVNTGCIAYMSTDDLILRIRTGAGAASTITYASFFATRYHRYVMLHIVGDGAGNIILYADGVLVSSTAFAYNLTTATNVTLGACAGVVSGYTGALWQSAKAWTRKLTQTEVTARFNWNSNTSSIRTSLAAEYLMTENTGTSVADGSGNSRTMTLSSMSWSSDYWRSPVLNQDGTHIYRLRPGVSSIAFSTLGKEATHTEWRNAIIECAGTVSTTLPLYLPKLTGAIWTINNKTSAGTIKAIGVTGTGVNVAVGLARVYFDGTNFISA